MSDKKTGQNPMSPVASSSFCGARTRQGGRCRQIPAANGRCYLHGGLSTGPRTAEGLERLRAARTVHGSWGREGRELRALVRELRAEARRVCAVV